MLLVFGFFDFGVCGFEPAFGERVFTGTYIRMYSFFPILHDHNTHGIEAAYIKRGIEVAFLPF